MLSMPWESDDFGGRWGMERVQVCENSITQCNICDAFTAMGTRWWNKPNIRGGTCAGVHCLKWHHPPVVIEGDPPPCIICALLSQAAHVSTFHWWRLWRPHVIMAIVLHMKTMPSKYQLGKVTRVASGSGPLYFPFYWALFILSPIRRIVTFRITLPH